MDPKTDRLLIHEFKSLTEDQKIELTYRQGYFDGWIDALTYWDGADSQEVDKAEEKLRAWRDSNDLTFKEPP